ncbi:hypothetical protein LXL04_019930 [Taraxacum kok-saghyz]
MLQVDVTLSDGTLARAAVPSGASIGIYEALELRDGGSDYLRKGVLKAVDNVNSIIGPSLIGKDPLEQTKIDNFMVQELDGTVNEWGWCKQRVSHFIFTSFTTSNHNILIPVYQFGANAILLRLLAHLCLIHDSDHNSAPSFHFGIQQVVSELKLEDLSDYFKSRSEMTNSAHESHSVLQVLIVEDSMIIRRVSAQTYLMLETIKKLGLYTEDDNVVYIINEDVKKKNDVKKKVSFNLENNTVHIIPDNVHDVLHDSEENKSPDVVEGESSSSENEEVVKSESEDVHSESESLKYESDVSSSSSNSFEGMVAYRKPVLQDLQKYETQSWNQTEDYVQKPYDVQIPKCDLHFRNTNSYLKPRNSQKKKKKRKIKKIWVPKVKNNQVCENVQKIVTNSIDSRKSVRRWRDEKKYQCWYNVIIDNFCFPTKEPKRSISSVYFEDRLISPRKGVSKIDTVQFRTLANFRNDSQIFILLAHLCLIHDSDHNSAPSFRFGIQQILAVSLAVCKAGASVKKIPLYKEFMILPVGASSFNEAMKMGVEVYHNLKSNRIMNLFIYMLQNNDGSQKISGGSLKNVYKSFVSDYPIVSIEDTFDQDDWEHYGKMMSEIGEVVQIVGDDLLVTNPKCVEKAIKDKSCNALLLKVNQIGSVTESIEAVGMSKRAGWGVMASHRSGETEDTFIADLSVSLSTGQIKTEAPCRSERIAKYNQVVKLI